MNTEPQTQRNEVAQNIADTLAMIHEILTSSTFNGDEESLGTGNINPSDWKQLLKEGAVGAKSGSQVVNDPYVQMLHQTVYGGEEDKGQGGLLGVLQQKVYGDQEGKGGLLNTLQQAVQGDESGKGGLLAELRQSVHGNGQGEGGLLGDLKKALGTANPPTGALGAIVSETGKGVNAIRSYWVSLFGDPIDPWAKDPRQRGDE